MEEWEIAFSSLVDYAWLPHLDLSQLRWCDERWQHTDFVGIGEVGNHWGCSRAYLSRSDYSTDQIEVDYHLDTYDLDWNSWMHLCPWIHLHWTEFVIVAFVHFRLLAEKRWNLFEADNCSDLRRRSRFRPHVRLSALLLLGLEMHGQHKNRCTALPGHLRSLVSYSCKLRCLVCWIPPEALFDEQP